MAIRDIMPYKLSSKDLRMVLEDFPDTTEVYMATDGSLYLDDEIYWDPQHGWGPYLDKLSLVVRGNRLRIILDRAALEMENLRLEREDIERSNRLLKEFMDKFKLLGEGRE